MTRHTISSELPAMSDGHETIPNLPSKEFDLNVFLQSIAKEISSEDLESLKFLCIEDYKQPECYKVALLDSNIDKTNHIPNSTSTGGVPKSCLSEINSTLELFRVLREKSVITRENLLTLQSMIWHIGRKDLYRRFVEFCKKLDNTLYFFKSQDMAEEGNDHVKFHVCGYTARSQEYLNKLREQVSKILCCPTERIFVRGVEESSSLWITLMIPTWCIEILISIDNKTWCVLQSLDVDKFLIPRLDREIISSLSVLASCNDDKPELQNVANKIKKFNFIEKPQITKGKENDDGKKEEKISKRRGHVGILTDIPSDKHFYASSGETIEGQIRDDGKKEEKMNKRRGHVGTLTPIPSDKHFHASSGETIEGQIRVVSIEDDGKKEKEISKRWRHGVTTLTDIPSDKPVDATSEEIIEEQIRVIPASPRTQADSGFQDVDMGLT